MNCSALYLGRDEEHLAPSPLPVSLSVSSKDMGTAARTASGRLYVSRPRPPVSVIEVKWEELTGEEAKSVTEVLALDSFAARFYDPAFDEMRTALFCAVSREARIKSVSGEGAKTSLSAKMEEI